MMMKLQIFHDKEKPRVGPNFISLACDVKDKSCCLQMLPEKCKYIEKE